jgi:quinohemoprotein ethanol dehydrogenase
VECDELRPGLDLVYLGVGNGFPHNQELRSPGGGDNLFLASIVAVHADTGEYAWHYQVCPAEQWDCTATADLTLATLPIAGKTRKVLMQAPKNGFFYVIDRETGEFLSAQKIAKVTWAEKIDAASGRPIENPGMRYQGKPGFFELWPGPLGAHSWTPQAYSPRTGLVYVPVLEMGALIGAQQPGGPEIAAGMGVTLIPEVELSDGRHSFLRAWNPVTQKLAWQVELPGTWPAGVLATAGDLVFQGRLDRRFVAYHAGTGQELWSAETESPIVGAPISYRLEGRQYVVVLTGSGGQGAGMQTIGSQAWRTDYRLPRRVLAFALDGSDSLPAFALPEQHPPADPDFAVDLARAQQGALLYATNTCLVCHGWNAVAGGAAPDLRFSPTILDAQSFEQVVREGSLKPKGMDAFPEIAAGDLEEIRFYLRARAQAFPAEQAALLAKQEAERESQATPGDFAGRWNIVIQSPVGPQNAVMELRVDGNAVSGTVTADQGSVEIAGEVAEGRAKLSGKASMPFPITIAYDLGVRSGVLSGENSNGPFGSFPVTGTR